MMHAWSMNGDGAFSVDRSAGWERIPMHARLAGWLAFDACVRACLQAPSSCVSWAFVRVQPATVCTAIITPPVPAGRPAGWLVGRPPGEPASQPWPGRQRQLRFPGRPVPIIMSDAEGGEPACLLLWTPTAPPPSIGRRARPFCSPTRRAGRTLAGRSRRPHTPIRTRQHAPVPACLRHVTWCPPPAPAAFFSPSTSLSYACALVHATPHSRCDPSAS